MKEKGTEPQSGRTNPLSPELEEKRQRQLQEQEQEERRSRIRTISGRISSSSDQGRMMGLTFHPQELLGMSGTPQATEAVQWQAILGEAQAALQAALEQAEAILEDEPPSVEELLVEHLVSANATEAYQAGVLSSTGVDLDEAKVEEMLKLIRQAHPERQVEALKGARSRLVKATAPVKARATRQRNQTKKTKKTEAFQREQEEGREQPGTRWFLIAGFLHTNWKDRLRARKLTRLVKGMVLLPGGYGYVKVKVQEVPANEDATGTDRWGRPFRVGHRDTPEWREVADQLRWALGNIQWQAIPEAQVMEAANSSSRRSWARHTDYWAL